MNQLGNFTGINFEKISERIFDLNISDEKSAMIPEEILLRKFEFLLLEHKTIEETIANVQGKGEIKHSKIEELIETDWEKVTEEMKRDGLLELESWDKFMEKIYQKFSISEEKLLVLLTNQFWALQLAFEYNLCTDNVKSQMDYLDSNARKALEKIKGFNSLRIFTNGPSSRPEKIREGNLGYRRHFVYYMAKLISQLEVLKGMNRQIILLIPESESSFKIVDENARPFDYTSQVMFERNARACAEINIYWIPKNDGSLPGNTTAIEMALTDFQSKITRKMLTYYGDEQRVRQYRYSRSYGGNDIKKNVHTNDLHRFFDLLVEFILGKENILKE